MRGAFGLVLGEAKRAPHSAGYGRTVMPLLALRSFKIATSGRISVAFQQFVVTHIWKNASFTTKNQEIFNTGGPPEEIRSLCAW